MSQSIDQRIVQMQFDNKQFEKGISESTKSLETFSSKLDMGKAADSLSGLEKTASKLSFASLTSSVGEVINKFSVLDVIGVTALVNIANSAVNTGKRILSSFTIDPIKTGLDEYETKIGSIQTILTNTASKGTTLEQVNDVLNDLNTYADLTIYNFAEMTRNIGTFTAAGVGLKESAIAIKGIANLAAGSGSTSQQASTAMYQLSQALAAGSVKLQDWNSVVNAGMGGELFQNALKETAKQMGVVVNEAIPFRETLADGWLTADVLTQTLAKFAEDEMLLEAATQVKTFTQMLDTMQESVQSGWSMSWEYILGDKAQAAELFTNINNGFNSIIEPIAEARNEMLKFWNENGGRDAVIQGLANVLTTLGSVLGPIRDGFRDIFPAMTGQQLVDISTKFKSMTENFKMGDTTIENIKNTFKGFFAIVDMGIKVLKDVASGFITLTSSFAPVGSGLLGITGNIGTFLVKLNESVQSGNGFTVLITKIGESLKSLLTFDLTGFKISLSGLFSGFGDWSPLGETFSKVLSKISNALKGFVNLMQPLIDVVGKIFGAIATAISNFIKDADINSLATLFNSGVLATVGLGIKGFIDNLSEVVSEGSGFLENVTGIFDGVKDSLEAYQTQLKAGSLLKIASAIGILAASLLVLSTIKPAEMTTALAGMTVLFVELTVVLKSFSGIMTGIGMGDMGKLTVGLIGISTAMLIMSGALKSMASLSWSEMLVGLTGLGVVLAELAIFMQVNEKMSVRSATGLTILAVAMNLFASAIAKIGVIGTQDVIQGLTAIGILLTELAVFVNMTSNAKGVTSTAVGLTLLGVAMNIFASAVSKFGTMDLETVGKGLISMAGALTLIGVAVNLMPKGLVSMGVGLMAVSTALIILSQAMQTFASFDSQQITNSLIMLGGALGIIAVGLNLMKSTTSGAVALTVMAAALALLTPSLVILGNLSLTQIGTSLLMIAGTFTVFGAAGLLLGPLTPVLLGLTAAIALFGAGCLAVGVGIGAFSAGMAALAVSGAAGVAAVQAAVIALTKLIPNILIAVAEGVIEFVKVLADGAIEIGKAALEICNVLLEVLRTLIPDAAEVIVELLVKLLEVIAKNTPDFMKAAADLTVSFLKGISDRIDDIISAGVDVLINFLAGLMKNIAKVADSGAKIIIEFVNSIANSIRTNTQPMIDAFKNLFSAILEAVIKLILGSVGGFVDAGTYIIKEGLIKGIDLVTSKVTSTITTIINKCVTSITNLKSKFAEAGKNIINGFIDGIKSKISEAANWAASLAKKALDSAKDALGIHSPSREFMKVGQYADEGLINGLRKYSGKVEDEGENLGNTAKNALRNSLSNMVNLLDSSLDTTPTIRPILDLSDVATGADKLSSLLGADSLSVARGRASIVSKRMAPVLLDDSEKVQNGSPVQIHNEFHIPELVVREEADIDRIATKLFKMQQQSSRSKGVLVY